MLSDARLLGIFTGPHREYQAVWDDGVVAYFRARNLRDARKVAAEFTRRLRPARTLVTVTRERHPQ